MYWRNSAASRESKPVIEILHSGKSIFGEVMSMMMNRRVHLTHKGLSVETLRRTNGGKDLEKLGQGLHALQDAIAHGGAKTNDHLGFNWKSAKKFMNDLYGSTSEAENLTRSALIVLDVINGKKDNLKSGDTLDLRGMSSGQMKQFLDGLLKLGFTGTIKNGN